MISEELLGTEGYLSVSTRGAEGPGEVVVPFQQGTEAFIAWSTEPLPRGTRVLVYNTRGGRTVDVSSRD